MCYRQSRECWGSEFAVMAMGQVKEACQAHQQEGRTRPPVVRIEVMDQVQDYDKYLTPFIKEEIGNVPGAMIYGTGSVHARLAADVLSWQHDMARCEEGVEPTHLFIAWDFEDEGIWDRIDHYLDKGVIIESVVP